MGPLLSVQTGLGQETKRIQRIARYSISRGTRCLVSWIIFAALG